jgi:hypothetical protein
LSSVDSLRNTDFIIIKIAENVESGGPNYSQFISYYDQLINYLDPSKKAVKLIVDGFWKKDPAISDIRNYALHHQYPLISIIDISTATANKSLAGHPPDQGIRLIANRLWNYTWIYF